MDVSRIFFPSSKMGFIESNLSCKKNDAVLAPVKTTADKINLCNKFPELATNFKFVRVGLHFMGTVGTWEDGERYNETLHFAIDDMDYCPRPYGCEVFLDCKSNSIKSSSIKLGHQRSLETGFVCYKNAKPATIRTTTAETTAKTILDTTTIGTTTAETIINTTAKTILDTTTIGTTAAETNMNTTAKTILDTVAETIFSTTTTLKTATVPTSIIAVDADASFDAEFQFFRESDYSDDLEQPKGTEPQKVIQVVVGVVFALLIIGMFAYFVSNYKKQHRQRQVKDTGDREAEEGEELHEAEPL